MIISCKCGCENGVHFKIDKEDYDMYCITTFTNSNWHRDQNDTILRVIGRKMKKIISILRNKDYVYSDLILSKTDFEEFKEYVNQF